MTDALAAHAHRQPSALNAARGACAAALSLLAARFGRPQATGGLLGVGAKRARQLAGQLSHVALALYWLQRGAVLGMAATPQAAQQVNGGAGSGAGPGDPRCHASGGRVCWLQRAAVLGWRRALPRCKR